MEKTKPDAEPPVELTGALAINVVDEQRIPLALAQNAATNGRLFAVLLVACDLTAVAVFGWRLYLVLALGGVGLAGLGYLGDLLPIGPLRAALVWINVALGGLLLLFSLVGAFL